MDNLSQRFRAEWDGLPEDEKMEIWRRLLYYAKFHYWWLTPKAPGGVDPPGLVVDAIKDAYDGKRSWPAGLAMVPFLQGVIHSKAGHAWEKVKRARPKEDSASPNDDGDAPPRDDGDDGTEESPRVGGIRRHAAHDYGQCRDAQRDADCRVHTNRFLKSLGDDALAKKILKLRLSDPMLPPRDLAAMLGVSVEEVYNAVKRLIKKWKKWEDNGDE